MKFPDSICTESNRVLTFSNILVAGGTSSGKTTLANAVIQGISTLCPQDRVLIIEDTAEIQCAAENALIFRANADVDLLRLLRISLCYRPDRILVGEVRGSEALALLKAWNTGHPGGVATIHANSAEAALIRLEQLIAEVGAVGMSPLIAEAVDLVVFMEKQRGKRRVREIIGVTGITATGYSLNHYQLKLVGWATKVARRTKPPTEDNTPEGGGLYLRSALRRTEVFFGLSMRLGGHLKSALVTLHRNLWHCWNALSKQAPTKAMLCSILFADARPRWKLLTSSNASGLG